MNTLQLTSMNRPRFLDASNSFRSLSSFFRCSLALATRTYWLWIIPFRNPVSKPEFQVIEFSYLSKCSKSVTTRGRCSPSSKIRTSPTIFIQHVDTATIPTTTFPNLVSASSWSLSLNDNLNGVPANPRDIRRSWPIQTFYIIQHQKNPWIPKRTSRRHGS